MVIKKRREIEASRIKRANRAAAVGRLMLGEISSWEDFLSVETIDYSGLPRRQLQAGHADTKKRLSPEIRRFCDENFENLDEASMSNLYEEIKSYRGLEIPIKDFENRYAKVKRRVLRGMPVHSTLVFGLFGLKFMSPEDYLAKDILYALKGLRPWIDDEENTMAGKLDEKGFFVRSSIVSSFNLLEAYLNGMAWHYIYENEPQGLSKKKIKLLEGFQNVSLKDKVLKYPEVVSGECLCNAVKDDAENFFKVCKPFRDSLVHPSPFDLPKRFGGYERLKLFYRADVDTTILVVSLVCRLIKNINNHVFKSDDSLPWLHDVVEYLSELGRHHTSSS
jgi:hypothetical protein